MSESMLTRLDDRIAACDTEIKRIRAEGAANIQAQADQKDILQKAKVLLVANPTAEGLLLQLKTLGVW